MFTGIVEEIGHLAQVKNAASGVEMCFNARLVLEGTRIGDSIAVNGTCLTVTQLTPTSFTVGVAPETRSRTNLVALKAGHGVNLERAVTPTTRLGGHFVQGHVDGVGTLVEKRSDGEACWLTIRAASEIMRYVVPKGFICLDGVSLTVVEVWPDRFNIMLVPHTQQEVILPAKKVGDAINIEVDILGKYVEKLLAGHTTSGPGVSAELLQDNGFH